MARISAILLIFFALSPAWGAETKSVTVFATTSIGLPVSEIAREYSRKTGVEVNATFEISRDLAKKIEDGDAADVFISPDAVYINKLKSNGLVTHETKDIARNSLLLVAARESGVKPIPGASLKELFNSVYRQTLMVIGDPGSILMGEETVKSLENLGEWKRFKTRVIRAPDSTSAIELIIKGKSAGIAYASDTAQRGESVVELAPLPADSYSPIVYKSVIVVGNNAAEARKFQNFLASYEGKKIFNDYGFK